MPSPLTDDDVRQLLQHCIKPSQRSLLHLFSDGIVVSNQFVNECQKIFEPIMKEKAENVSMNSINFRVQLKFYHSFYRIKVLVSHVKWCIGSNIIIFRSTKASYIHRCAS